MCFFIFVETACQSMGVKYEFFQLPDHTDNV